MTHEPSASQDGSDGGHCNRTPGQKNMNGAGVSLFSLMEPATAIEIREFKIRGSYANRRNLFFQRELHQSSKPAQIPGRPGYSPPIVEFELSDGTSHSITVREADALLLADDDNTKANGYVSLIVEARAGEPGAVEELSSIAQKYFAAERQFPQPSESSFVVPCTSSQPHSEQAISHKASILLRLYQLGYAVPDFVVLTAEAYIDRAKRLEGHLADALKQLEVLTMQGLGDAEAPLAVAVRCATGHYIPGVMDTYLNVGVTQRTLPGLERMYGCVAAHKMFLNNLKNLCRFLDPEKHTALVRAVTPDLTPPEVDRMVGQMSDILAKTDRALIEDPFAQALFFAKQCYKDFEQNEELVLTLCRGTEPYPSIILQKMICTVRHENAYAGVISSRHTQTGVGVELQTAHNIFGEEIMTGAAEVESTAFEDREAVKDAFPAVYHFVPHLAELERQFESPVTIEFAVEATSKHQWFALLQLNETAMAGRAAFVAVVDMHKSGTISRQRVTDLIRPYHVKQLTSDTIEQEVFDSLDHFCGGVAVLPRSAVSARIYFSSEAALQAKSQGQRVCLCKETFVPTDTVVMREVDAIVSLTSAAIHVVTICHSLGIPGLLSLEKNGVTLKPGEGLVNSSGKAVHEGDWVTLSSKRKTLYEGEATFVPGRFLRYMRGEAVQMDGQERETFAAVAYAYRYYQQLIRGLKVDQIDSLTEVTRLVNFELGRESEEASRLVNGWFDEREAQYLDGVLKSDIGDHLGQSNVFQMLSLDRKIKFFKRATEKCAREHISGYEAGAFMLGRFLCVRYPAAFWRHFSPAEIGLLVNEWVLFEKYMQVLHNVGEREALKARKQILKGGLDQLTLHPGSLQSLITIKLSRAPLDEVRKSLPEWTDPQSAKVLELLQLPYRAFYDFNAPWSVGRLQQICREENLPVPAPDDA